MPKCEKCRSERVEDDYPGINSVLEGWVCPLAPKDCRIAELEQKAKSMYEAGLERARQINQLKEKLRNPEQRFAYLMAERDTALAESRKRGEEVAALREALESSPNHGDYCEGADDADSCGYCQWFNRRKEILSNTSATAQQTVERIEKETIERAINTPEVLDFMKAVPLEAAHQRERWGSEKDEGKSPEDWFWLLGYLAGKSLAASKAGDPEKAKHHTISCAAALANWHSHLSTGESKMRPGIADPDSAAILGEKGKG